MLTSSARKARSSREKVLKAATALFASKGFHETSTRDVARRARVNEITIYRLFKNKQALYLEVLDANLALIGPEWLSPILQSSDDSEEVFLALAMRLEQIFNPIFLRLLFYAALEKPELLEKCYRPRLMCFYDTLTEHIRKRIDLGVLRTVEPILMGRSLVAMIAYHQIVCQLLGGRDFPGCDIADATKHYVDIWTRGSFPSGVFLGAAGRKATKPAGAEISLPRPHTAESR
jgi:AcrR family transcriptional regulator